MTGRMVVLTFALFALTACGNAMEFALPDDTSREGEETVQPQVLEQGVRVLLMGLTDPNYSEAEKAQVLAKYPHLDPKHVVPTNLLQKTVLYYHWNLSKIANKNFITVVDFSKRSTKLRFFTVDMKTGAVLSLHVAHGTKSDPNSTGYATLFSNVNGSNKSSLGYYLTGEVYSGNNGRSMRLHGLSNTNSNVLARAVVIHGAAYVTEADVVQGRSWGCFALATNYKDRVINNMITGAVMYAGLSGIK